MNSVLRKSPLPILVLLVGLASSAFAAEWIEGSDYDAAIQDPSTFLGRPFAERHTEVDEIFAYARQLARSSDRVTLETMGTSVQGDPLMLLVITDPANRPALAARDSLLRVTRDAWSHSESERQRASEGLVPAVWFACSVHGDEASGSDAGVMLAYHLTADRSEVTRKVLRETVVLIGVSHNPDGRRRFLQHVRSYGRQKMAPDPSPWAAEHWQTWPGGRTNHFLFDLNRDWAFLTQQETRSHVAAFLRWRPQVFVDLHEMGRESSYFFPPPADPINPNIPKEQLAWFETFGKANAEAFDARGYDYFVREDFDLFYPGYGDSWPTLQGAVGMTFEQATTRGRALRQRGGKISGYADAVRQHLTAAWTTTLTTAHNADALLEANVDFASTARDRASHDDRKELVFSIAHHGAEAARLAEVLARQGITVWRTTEDSRLRLTEYDGVVTERVVIPRGSFRVPLEQPAYALVRSLLDPHTSMDEDFLAEEKDRRDHGLRSRIYDVTAWSLVFSYGVEAYTSSKRLDVPSEPVRVEGSAPVDLLVHHVDLPVGTPVAWAIPYRDNSAIAALQKLWGQSIEVECVLGEFEVQGRVMPRGTLVVKRHANAHVDDLDLRMVEIAEDVSADLVALHHSWTDRGASLGSGAAIPLLRPRIGLVTGPGVSPLSVGGLNWLLEDRYGIEFTSLMLGQLDRVDLEEFDAILVPELRDRDELPLEALDHWVRGGGVLVVVGDATAALVDAEEPWTTVERITDLADLSDDDGRIGDLVFPSRADDAEGAGPLPPERKPLRTPGAIARLDLDARHYLSVGEGAVAYAPVLSDRLLTPSITGQTVARFDAEAPRRAGFAWPAMEEALKGKAFLVEERRDRGRVILFAEDPGFRGTWEGLHRLLLNGLLLGPNVKGL